MTVLHDHPLAVPEAVAFRPWPEGIPEIVVLCGSTRFQAELKVTAERETLAGRIVVAPAVDMHAPEWDGRDDADDVKERLDQLHRAKIRLADTVVVVAPGGYIGTSTRAEIDYAAGLGKPLRYLT